MRTNIRPLFILKINSVGVVQWEKLYTYGNDYNQDIPSISINQNGDLVIFSRAYDIESWTSGASNYFFYSVLLWVTPEGTLSNEILLSDNSSEGFVKCDVETGNMVVVRNIYVDGSTSYCNVELYDIDGVLIFSKSLDHQSVKSYAESTVSFRSDGVFYLVLQLDQSQYPTFYDNLIDGEIVEPALPNIIIHVFDTIGGSNYYKISEGDNNVLTPIHTITIGNDLYTLLNVDWEYENIASSYGDVVAGSRTLYWYDFSLLKFDHTRTTVYTYIVDDVVKDYVNSLIETKLRDYGLIS